MAKVKRLMLIAILWATVCVPSVSVVAQEAPPPAPTGLSPYWWEAVSRWESVILKYAGERHLDPDLIAAVIWKESRGKATSNGPVGAIGLMGLMPFPWRPSPEELENPWTNVAWGARALAHTIRDGKGDLYYSLAAYNGGWDQIHLRVTRRYAADVLSHYSRAVAVRNGLPADGHWLAVFALNGVVTPKTFTVVGPHRALARYTARPYGRADIPIVPPGLPPCAIAITFTDEFGVEHEVGVWLLDEDGNPLVPSVGQSFSSHLLAAESAYDVPTRDVPLRVLEHMP